MDLPPYQYDPIESSRVIRLLSLEPGFKFSPLRFSLQTASLDDHPNFEAVSYVWGDATLKYPVVCDGKRLEITQNLKDALERFRQEDESRLLWADAVCINQDDMEERASQVRLMWDIYAFASGCLVWLGKSTADTVTAIHLMKDLVHEVYAKDADSLAKDGDFRKKIERMSAFSQRLPPVESPLWQPVLTFFDRPYFSRIWVVQEINACSQVTAFCGTYQLDWAHVVLTAQWVGTDSDYGNKKLQVQRLAETDGWWTAGNMSSVFKRYSSPNDVARILQAFHACEATNWRDKIYALMGFDIVKTALTEVKIDYTTSLEVLYTQVARIILHQSEKLDLLSYHWHGRVAERVSSQSTLPDFPSWVPRWHQPPDQQTLLLAPLGLYDASGGLKRDMIIIDDNILRVSGHVYDAISTVGKVKWVDVSAKASHYNTLMAPMFAMPFFIGEDFSQSPSQEMLGSFLFAVTAGLDEFQNRMDKPENSYRKAEHRAKFNNWYNCLWQFGYNLFPGKPRMHLESKPVPDWEEFQLAAFAATRGRCIFKTDEGKIGIGPMGAQKGDIVCVLHGGDVLYVLRPIDKHFVLVGEAYVHGAMDGEIVKDESRWPWRSFDID